VKELSPTYYNSILIFWKGAGKTGDIGILLKIAKIIRNSCPGDKKVVQLYPEIL
jgi:hypothetical protein